MIYRYIGIRVSNCKLIELHIAEAFLVLFTEVLQGTRIHDPGTFLESAALRSVRKSERCQQRELEDLVNLAGWFSEDYALPAVNCALFMLLESILTEKEAEYILLVYFLGTYPSKLRKGVLPHITEVNSLLVSGLRTLRIWKANL